MIQTIQPPDVIEEFVTALMAVTDITQMTKHFYSLASSIILMFEALQTNKLE